MSIIRGESVGAERCAARAAVGLRRPLPGSACHATFRCFRGHDHLRANHDMLEEGNPAPDFTAQTDEGSSLQLRALKGKPVVLYFYPKDDTPG